MEGSFKVEGLDKVMENLVNAFPREPEEQRKVLNSGMRKSSTQTIVREAKARAAALGGSGALAEAIGVRAKSKRRVMTSRAVAGVEITPIRHNAKAIAMYANYYYIRQGKPVPTRVILSGIRHGHLVEFGTVRTAAKPFLWQAATSQLSPFMRRLAEDMERTIRSRLKRRAKTKTVTGRAGR